MNKDLCSTSRPRHVCVQLLLQYCQCVHMVAAVNKPYLHLLCQNTYYMLLGIVQLRYSGQHCSTTTVCSRMFAVIYEDGMSGYWPRRWEANLSSVFFLFFFCRGACINMKLSAILHLLTNRENLNCTDSSQKSVWRKIPQLCLLFKFRNFSSR